MQKSAPIILLEHPRPHNPSRYQDVVNAPLSASLFSPYISSLLKSKAIPVEILDAHLLGWSIDRTLEELSRRPLKLLGVHTLYLWNNTQEVFSMLSQLTERNIKAHINLFGYYPTFAYQSILEQFPFIDSITIGEPEYTFLELAQGVISVGPHHSASGVSGVKGLAYRLNGEVVKNSPRALISDLDSLPFPDRSQLPLFKKRGLATYILGSRGCYTHCTFCYLNPFYGEASSWRGRSPENIFEELRGLYAQEGIRYFYFADANFFGPGREGMDRAAALAGLLTKEGLDTRFGIECRANDIEEESLSQLVKAGLREIFLGIESGCQHVLNRFKKGITLEINKTAINTLRGFGIEPNMGFIMFEPGSTLGDIRTNFEFLRETRLLRSPAVTAHLLHHRETLFQGTPDYPRAPQRPGTKLESFTGYEFSYQFTDPRVASFSEIVTSLCLKTLHILEPGDAEACPSVAPEELRRACSEILVVRLRQTLPKEEIVGAELALPKERLARIDKINKSLIKAFDQILRMFERKETGPDHCHARKIQEEALREIESIYCYGSGRACSA